jgi:hypothetical protein
MLNPSYALVNEDGVKKEKKSRHSLDGPALVYSYTFTSFCALPTMTKGHHILDGLGLKP